MIKEVVKGIIWSRTHLAVLLSSNAAPVKSQPALAAPHAAQVNGEAPWLRTSKMVILLEWVAMLVKLPSRALRLICHLLAH